MKTDTVSMFTSDLVTEATVRVHAAGTRSNLVFVSLGSIELMMTMEMLQHLTCAAVDVLDKWFAEKEKAI